MEEIGRRLDALPEGRRVMLKLTIPDVPDLYAGLMKDPRVVRVVALSGGYPRDEACQRLAANHGMIASFSRALTETLKVSMTDAEFDAALASAIEQIYQAATVTACGRAAPGGGRGGAAEASGAARPQAFTVEA